MNFDFNVKEWDRNSQIIAAAVVLGLISLILPWFSYGSYSENGFRFIGIFPWLFMGYPAFVVLTRSEMKRDISIACATVPIATVLYFILYMSFEGGGDVVGIGMYLFIICAIACGYGVYNYKTPQPTEPKVIEVEATPVKEESAKDE